MFLLHCTFSLFFELTTYEKRLLDLRHAKFAKNSPTPSHSSPKQCAFPPSQNERYQPIRPCSLFPGVPNTLASNNKRLHKATLLEGYARLFFEELVFGRGQFGPRRQATAPYCGVRPTQTRCLTEKKFTDIFFCILDGRSAANEQR